MTSLFPYVFLAFGPFHLYPFSGLEPAKWRWAVPTGQRLHSDAVPVARQRVIRNMQLEDSLGFFLDFPRAHQLIL